MHAQINIKFVKTKGFVRYLSDPTNYAFIPEEIQPNQDQLHYPLSYYYICSSHNT